MASWSQVVVATAPWVSSCLTSWFAACGDSGFARSFDTTRFSAFVKATCCAMRTAA